MTHPVDACLPLARRPRRRAASSSTLAIAIALSFAVASFVSADGTSETGTTPGPSATEAKAIDAMAGAEVVGDIPGLSVEVTSAVAYRDWMPSGGGERAEDGGSPLHVVIGLSISNAGSATVRLERSARIGAVDGSRGPIALDDLSGATVWPLIVPPGALVQLQIGTREGPILPVATSITLEIVLRDAEHGQVVVSFASLAIGRTE